MNSNAQASVVELGATLSRIPEAWRSELLMRVTELLVSGLDSYSKNQVAIFDEILVRLAENAPPTALVDLSTKLAPHENAPVYIVISLARNEDWKIASPVLENSPLLTDQDIIDIAMMRRSYHLAAIAGRRRLTEAISDILVERGNTEVSTKLVSNHGARISEHGFVRLINQAKTDRTLAAAIATRKDMPPELIPFLKLTLE